LWIFLCEAWRRGSLIGSAAFLVSVLAAGSAVAEPTPVELSLGDAILRALGRSFGVEAARRDSAAAALSYSAARALRFPDVSLTARSTYKNEVPTFDINMPPIVFEREMGSKEVYQADLEISQPLFAGGRIANNIRAERERSLAEAAGLKAEEMATAYTCRRTYLEAMLAGELATVAEASLARVRTIEQDVEALFQSGMADSVDVLDAAMAVKRAEQGVADQRVAYELALTGLRRQTGLPESQAIRFTEKIPLPSESILRPAEPPMGRPELERLERLANAANFMTSLSRADYFPSLGGFATYSYGKPNQDLFQNTWNDYLMVGLRLTWTLNLAGRSSLTTAAAAEKARAAKAAEKDLRDQLIRQYESALEQADYAFDTMKRAGRQSQLAHRKFALARQQQVAGTLSTNRLLEMEIEVSAFDRQEVASTIQFYLAENDYLYATGSKRVLGGIR
jgi:outer membrane protein